MSLEQIHTSMLEAATNVGNARLQYVVFLWTTFGNVAPLPCWRVLAHDATTVFQSDNP